MIIDRSIYNDKTYITSEGYEISILQYLEKNKVLIQFNHFPDLQIWTTIQNVKNGQIKNPYHKSAYGIGYYGVGQYTSRINNKKTKQYIKWFSMFTRCYNEDYLTKQPTYKECYVDESFHNFQNFAKWYDNNIYDCTYELELDKDFLYEGNKKYSPSTCCFIPKEINSTINSKRHDVQTMNYLYQKYKNELPYYLRIHLYELTKEVA